MTDYFARTTKRLAANLHTIWLVATTSPYAKKSGMWQSIPDASSFVAARAFLAVTSSEDRLVFEKSLQSENTPLPELENSEVAFPANSRRMKRWRTSGPQGHYIQSAAAAYLIHDSATDFGNRQRSWAGRGGQSSGVPI